MIIVLCGNDGTGKSTVCKELCKVGYRGQRCTPSGGYPMECVHPLGGYPMECVHPLGGYHAIERNRMDTSAVSVSEDSVKFMDRITLSPFSEDLDSATYEVKVNDEDVYYIVLDADVEVLRSRISKRQSTNGAFDFWETTKALFYYQQKFRELAAYYGFPIIDTSRLTIDEVIRQVLQMVEVYEACRKLAGQKMTFDFINRMDIENKMYAAQSMTNLSPTEEDHNEYAAYAPPECVAEYHKRSHIRRLVRQGRIPDNVLQEIVHGDRFYLQLITEGESKKIFKIVFPAPECKPLQAYFDRFVIIVLKSTIYSHSKQATGKIKGLGKVRGEGSRLFMEMMHRNGLRHSYRCISRDGIILSEYISEIPPTEIVVKRRCEGTDKHSYYGIQKFDRIVSPENSYRAGLYVRFDWRNPNHVTRHGISVTEAIPNYYILEEIMGKEYFFETYLARNNPFGIVPYGDKCISEELVKNVIDTGETEMSAIKIFTSIQHYLSQLSLEVQDACFMLNAEGTVFWSEINEDCMRIKTAARESSTTAYDKDIWRAGGSSKSAQILDKWTTLNNMLREYFVKHPFHSAEQVDFYKYPYQHEIEKLMAACPLISPKYQSLFEKIISGATVKRRKRIIATMDLYDQRPVLVQSGQVLAPHTSSIEEAMAKICIFPDILVVDLNGAIDGVRSNAPVIRDLARQHYVHSGGGIRTLEDVQDLLGSSVRRVVVSSNLSEEFLNTIPKDRLIVELSVDSNNSLLIKGRREDTKISILEKLPYLARLGVQVISVTFHASEGRLEGLPRQQIFDLMARIPAEITKVIVAGGISTMDDLQFLWGFDKVVPQLGSAIWKDHIAIGDLYCAMTNFDHQGLVSTVIQDIHGRVLGNVYMNRESLRRTCQERMLYRYSRKFGKVMMKGAESGNVQPVLQISHDCDCDSLLVTVGPGTPQKGMNPFCHTGNESCFSLQTVAKTSMGVLEEHLWSRKGANSYSGRMQQNPGFALAKVMEEFWEIVSSNNRSHRVQECSDLIIHLLMYLSAENIQVSDILNVLNARRWTPRLLQSSSSSGNYNVENIVVIAMTPSKYVQKSLQFAEQELGIRIYPQTSRDLRIRYDIIDRAKYEQYFGTRTLVLVPARPKDMPWQSAHGRIDGAITYNTVVENHPKVFRCVVSVPDVDLRLCLIKRKEEDIDVANFAASNKLLLAAEHCNHVHDFMSRIMPETNFSMDRVVGSSEGYMVNQVHGMYTLCDAIVETGKTLDENNLELWRVILDYGQVTIGLFFNLRFQV
jgi:phosphoribosyl-AMP cyclohydrolase/phosphoribosyl-ATP pyrophosphohydrolase/uncharacterized protein related to proFAR isomerase